MIYPRKCPLRTWEKMCILLILGRVFCGILLYLIGLLSYQVSICLVLIWLFYVVLTAWGHWPFKPLKAISDLQYLDDKFLWSSYTNCSWNVCKDACHRPRKWGMGCWYCTWVLKLIKINYNLLSKPLLKVEKLQETTEFQNGYIRQSVRLLSRWRESPAASHSTISPESFAT